MDRGRHGVGNTWSFIHLGHFAWGYWRERGSFLSFFFSSLTSTHIPRDWEQLLLPPRIMKNYNLEYLWYIQDSSICQKNPGGQDTDTIAPSLLLFPAPLPELPPPQSSLTTHSAVPTCTMYLHALMKKAQLGDS